MKVCLDAGHYGKCNQSPADKHYYEPEIVWKLYLLQKKYLEAYSIEVITAREERDTDRGPYERGAASGGCDLFLSNHSNAVGGKVNNSVDYPATYCAINGSADEIGMVLAQRVEIVLSTDQPARIEHRRGQNGDHYGVLRGVTAVGTPGLILENSFRADEEIVRWLLNDANLERFASARADIIALYYGIMDPLNKFGWAEENGGQRFYLGDIGRYVANDWYKDGDNWYWFDGAGMMIHNDWKAGSDGEWHYFQETGAMARDQQVIWKNELHRLKDDGSMSEGCVYLETDEEGAMRFPLMGRRSDPEKIDQKYCSTVGEGVQ